MKQLATNHRKPFLFVALFLLAVFISGPTHAGVYKYQDEDGNWHFSDRPVGEMEDSAGRL